MMPNGHLTPRQLEVLSALITSPASQKVIAARLNISPRTLQHHIGAICAKVGARSRLELCIRYYAERERSANM